jgi:glycosyltransferase involved in cell wall biosynthesis
MRAAIYNPYLDTLGGGERYTLSFANALAKNCWKVDIEWKDEEIKPISESRFGISLDNIDIVPNIKKGDGYDLCFWVSDGSIPTLSARKNILHFQVPFHDVGGKSLLNRMKIFRINKIVCNSNFTKTIIDKEYGVTSEVIYPPVPVEEIRPRRKENSIIYVGRFSQLKQSKRQDVLIKAFKKLFDGGFSDWKLILAGGVELGVGDFVTKLRKMSEGYPIEIIESPDFKTLKELYGKSKIFWSASGYGEDEDKFPEKVEHFGMTVVEAMTAGAVPFIYSAGGHKEIVNENNGFLWTSVGELIKKTKKNIKNPSEMKKIAERSKQDSKLYSTEEFERHVLKLI